MNFILNFALCHLSKTGKFQFLMDLRLVFLFFLKSLLRWFQQCKTCKFRKTRSNAFVKTGSQSLIKGIRFPSVRSVLELFVKNRKSQKVSKEYSQKSAWRNTPKAKRTEVVCSVVDYTDWGIGIDRNKFQESINHLWQDRYAFDI